MDYKLVDVPEETKEKLIRITALRILVKKSVKLFWGEKRAIRYQVESETLMYEVKSTLYKLFNKEIEVYGYFDWGFFEDDFKVRYYNIDKEKE